MMNAARLHVAVQGLGHAEAAYQNALQYARERRQMRAPGAGRNPAGTADAIVKHPAIRRTLLELRAYVQGERALAYWCAHLLDVAEHHPDPARREEAHALASLLTPVAKAFCTENGFALASAAMQVFGGHGYLHDNAIEQTVRDSRIAMIYEGTNEIQAIDLLVRKILGDGGATFARLAALMREEAVACEGTQECSEYGRRLVSATTVMTQAVAEIAAVVGGDPELPYRAAGDFLRAFGLLLIGYAWARAARIAYPQAGGSAFHAEKLQTAKFFFNSVFPEFDHRLRLITVAREPLAVIDTPD
jgi:hypothetical protein